MAKKIHLQKRYIQIEYKGITILLQNVEGNVYFDFDFVSNNEYIY